MRERVAFVHQDVSLDPDTLDFQEAGFLGPQIETTRQDILTISPNELPLELAHLLENYEGVHVRWASALQYETLDPFSSRISPGLHVYFSPARSSAVNSFKNVTNSESISKLCGWLQRFGPLDCSSPEAFTELKPGDLSSAPPVFSFYQGLEDLHSFIANISQEFCPELDSVCNARLRSLYTAAGLDVSYATNDKGNPALTVSARWPLRAHTLAVPASSERRVEVGVFINGYSQPNMKHYELGVAGVLKVLGEDRKLSPTMFTFPSRHRQDDSVFTSKFLSPTGLHPTLQLSFSSSRPPTGEGECAPYAFLTLPKTIFADRYQLGDELFLASKNITASRYTTLPVDLEAPAYTTEVWGSNVLLELAPPDPALDQSWTAEVPLHLRYLEPSASGEVAIEVPYPAIFWACSSGWNNLHNPFDRVDLGYDKLFPEDTVFWHVTPQPESGKRLTSPVTVPVLKEEGAALIVPGTTVAVAFGFAWVLWKLIGFMIQPGKKSSDKETRGAQKKTE